MYELERMSVPQFFEWQSHVEGRYELVDGRIVPHPDYVSVRGLAAPDNDHARVVARIATIFSRALVPPCDTYVGAGVALAGANANVPDLAVSCSEADRTRSVLEEPRIVVEVSSPKTAHVDVGRKVADYATIASLDVYLFVDRKRRSITLYRPEAGPQTHTAGDVLIACGVTLAIDELFA